MGGRGDFWGDDAAELTGDEGRTHCVDTGWSSGVKKGRTTNERRCSKGLRWDSASTGSGVPTIHVAPGLGWNELGAGAIVCYCGRAKATPKPLLVSLITQSLLLLLLTHPLTALYADTYT